jgi:alkylated DNA repair dioxygenase AlkB
VTYPEDEETHAPKSFFGDDSTRTFEPKDPQLHEPLDVQSFLEKRLRWMALGGQHEGSAKIVSGDTPPVIPEDISKLLSAALLETSAHTAIVNIQSTRDTQSIHREVSKDGDLGLMSVSFGCDGLFLASHDDGNGCEIFRLRSGDAVYMNGASRFAWHGVPKILASTCPAWLSIWPSLGENIPGMPPGPYQMWEGWMSSKRITLNVQQRPSPHASRGNEEHV